MTGKSYIKMLAECAVMGIGLACVTEKYITDYVEDGRLFMLTLEKEVPERSIGLAYPSNWPFSEPASEFVRVITGASLLT
jgi:DNA-binding transcriptional LysR family regulator